MAQRKQSRVEMRMLQKFGRREGGIVLTWALVGAIAIAAAAQAAPSVHDLSGANPGEVPFQIDAQPIEGALKEFATQAHLQLIYETTETGLHIQSADIAGRFTPEAALSRLLAHTDLGYKFINNRTVSIRPTAHTENEPVSDGALLRLVSAAPAPAVAPSASGEPSAGAEASDLAEVVVTGSYQFLSVDTSGTTNLPLPIEKVPQSISLVSGDFIKAADLKTLADIAEYTPGAINVGNAGNSGSLIKLRGFTPGRSVDGINVLQPIALYEPDNAIFDRIEVVKGPSSVVYGVSSPGGVVNYVTKSATAQTPNYLYAQVGSWSSFRVEGQVAGALDSAEHIRGIAVAVRDQGHSFMNVMHHTATTLYGGINADWSNSITAYLHGGYQRVVRPAFDGIPTEADGSPAPLPRSFFIGSKSLEFTTSVYHVEADIAWHATDMLEFSVKGNYETTHSTGYNAYSYGLTPDGDIGLVSGKGLDEHNDNYGIGLSSIYRLDALGIKNSFVSVGALYQSERLPYRLLYGSGSANIFDGEAAISQAFEAALSGPLSLSVQNINAHTLTYSAQSVLQVLDPLSVLLGVSYSKPAATQSANYVNDGIEQNFSIGGQVSYRAGLTYEFLPKANAYVSFSQSFNPQLQDTVDNNVLPPIKANEYEVGLKYRPGDGRLLLTGALFQIKERNLGQYDTTIGSISYFKPIGEVTHKGFEIQALGEVTRQWQVNAGYAYLNPKITNDSVESNIGQLELFLPRQTASIYSTYTLETGALRGLSFGAGARYVSSQHTAYDGSSKDLPGYTLIDATLGYKIEKWLVQLSGRNVFDKHYFINNYQTLFYGNAVGDPANVALSIRRQF